MRFPIALALALTLATPASAAWEFGSRAGRDGGPSSHWALIRGGTARLVLGCLDGDGELEAQIIFDRYHIYNDGPGRADYSFDGSEWTKEKGWFYRARTVIGGDAPSAFLTRLLNAKSLAFKAQEMGLRTLYKSTVPVATFGLTGVAEAATKVRAACVPSNQTHPE